MVDFVAIKANGDIYRDSAVEGKTLQTFQSAVGGYIESILLVEHPWMTMLANEEIHLTTKHPQYNFLASELAKGNIYGDAILVGEAGDEGETLSLDVNRLEQLFEETIPHKEQ